MAAKKKKSKSRSGSRSGSRSTPRRRSRYSKQGKSGLRFERARAVSAASRAADEYGGAGMENKLVAPMRVRKIPISVTVARNPEATSPGKAFIGCVEFLSKKECKSARNPHDATAHALRKVASMVSGRRGAFAGLGRFGRRRRRRRR